MNKMQEKFTLKDGRIVTIKRLDINDYERNNNYEFVHSWIRKISKYLARDFKPENLEENKKFLYNSLNNKESNITLGAIYDGKIIGSSSLELNPSNEKMKHVGNWGIIIHPDFQNKGLGRKLIKSIEKIAKDMGLVRLETVYIDGNQPAENLYVHKFNYIIEGRKKFGARLKDGKYVDSIQIGKIFEGNM